MRTAALSADVPTEATTRSVSAEHQATGSCANCEADLAGGVFCAACGQRCTNERLRLRSLAVNVFHRVFDLERGLFYTVARLFVDPGGVARRYVQGQRRRFVNPVAYFFLTATAWLAMHVLTEEAFIDYMTAQLSLYFANLGEGLTPAEVREAAEQGSTINKVAFSYLLLAMCLPFAGLLRLFFARQGYNFAETLVFALYAMAQTSLIIALLTPGVFWLGYGFLLWASLTVGFAFHGYAALGFYGRRPRAVLLVITAHAGAWLAYLAMGVLAGVTVRLLGDHLGLTL